MDHQTPSSTSSRRKYIVSASIFFIILLVFLMSVNQVVEPLIRSRLHTLIIQGSDSLYTYTLGNLQAHFLSGRVEVENLQIRVDSNRYAFLKQRQELPSLTMQLTLGKGSISGLKLLSLVFGETIHIEKIQSKEANIRLSRHETRQKTQKKDLPLWKSIQSDIKSITINQIKLDGLKLLYKHADTAASVKLQFDRCDALFEDVQIDSTSSSDPERIAFSKNIDIGFSGIKFRSADSSYKMKAVGIKYSTLRKFMEVDSFKMQPTLPKDDFYRLTNRQQELYYIELEKMRLVNVSLVKFINDNKLEADSAVCKNPDVKIYTDKSAGYPDFESKIGKYPHQKLLAASTGIDIRHIVFSNTQLTYTQKDVTTLQEGAIDFSRVNIEIHNLTNTAESILKDSVCMISMKGMILNKSPFELALTFPLDAPDGQYHASGTVKQVSAMQLNNVLMPLANAQVNSFLIHDLTFKVRGNNDSAISTVSMKYNDLYINIRKTDQLTGKNTTNVFITKLLNNLVLRPNNPDESGNEKIASHQKVLRISSQSFFGTMWKSIFSGIQAIVMKGG